MQIKNPTQNKIEGIRIGTRIYSIEAEGTLDNVPEADARYWQENLHKFLILRKDKAEAPAPEPMPVPPAPEVVEATEEVVEEEAVVVEEEAPIEEVKSSFVAKLKGKKSK